MRGHRCKTPFYFLLFGCILLLLNKFRSPPIIITLSYVYVSTLKLHLTTKINLHGVSDSTHFRNHLRVRLSPLKSHIHRNSRSKYRRSVLHPSISKCNAKRCSCCKHLCCKSTINSNVNGRQCSVVTNSDLVLCFIVRRERLWHAISWSNL